MYRYMACIVSVMSMYRYMAECKNHVSIHANTCHVSIHVRCRVYTIYVSIHNKQSYYVSIHTRPCKLCMYRYIVGDTIRLTMYRYTFWNLQMLQTCITGSPLGGSPLPQTSGRHGARHSHRAPQPNETEPVLEDRSRHAHTRQQATWPAPPERQAR